MKKYFLKDRRKGQSVVEYTILFVIAVGIIVVAVNGPIRNSLSNVFTDLIDNIQAKIGSLAG